MEKKIIKMSPEMKEKLNSFLGISLENEFFFTPDIYKTDEKMSCYAPVFKLKGKDGLESSRLEDLAGHVVVENGRTKYVSNSGSIRIETLKSCLLSIKNFYLSDNSILEYSRNEDGSGNLKIIDMNGNITTDLKDNFTCVFEIIKYIPPSLQEILVNRIIEGGKNSLSEEEKMGLE